MNIQEFVICRNILNTLVNKSVYPENQFNCVVFLYNIVKNCKNKICRNDVLDEDVNNFILDLENNSDRVFFDKWIHEMDKRNKFSDCPIDSIIEPEVPNEFLSYFQTAHNNNSKLLVTQDPKLLKKRSEFLNDHGIQIINIDEANDLVIKFQNKISTEDQVLTETANRITKFRSKKLDLSDYKMFLDQIKDFTENQAEYHSIRESMVKLLKRVKDFYFTFEDMATNLMQQINGIIIDNDYYFVVFDESWDHSESFWSYYLTKINQSANHMNKLVKASNLIEILKTEIINEDNQKDIIFIDDIIGTGNTFIRRFENNLKQEFERLGEDITKHLKLFLISGIGSIESTRLIQQKTPLTRSCIRYGITIRDEDKAFSSNHWVDPNRLSVFKDFLKKLDPKHWNGFFGVEEYLVVFEWNIPNSTLSCLWKNNIKLNEIKWVPLFPRS